MCSTGVDHPLLFRYTWSKCVEVSLSNTDILKGLARLILIYSPRRKSLIAILLLSKNGFGWHLLLENWLFLSFLYPRILFICRSVLKKLKPSADFQIKIHFDLYSVYVLTVGPKKFLKNQCTNENEIFCLTLFRSKTSRTWGDHFVFSGAVAN